MRRHPCAGSLPGLEPALGDELVIRGDDGITRDAEVGGQRAARWETGARNEPTGAHHLAKRGLEVGAAASSA
jgi:hypothetical protein